LWRPLTPPLRHAGILCIMTGALTEAIVVAQVLALISSSRSLADQLFMLEGPAETPSWRQYRPFARKPRPLLRV
jgi:hypothetical protein